MSNKKRLTALLVCCVVLAAAPAAAQVVSDGDFSTWNFGSFGTGGSASMTRELTGGNPGPRLNVSTSTASSTAFATGLKTDFSTTAALEGRPYTLSLDVLSGKGAFGQGNAIHLLVEQGGTIYTQSLGVTNVQASFTTLQFPGVLNSASFARQSGAGPATPVFNGTVATRFGFAAGNSLSVPLTQYYDNFLLTIAGATPTPSPTAIPASATPTAIPPTATAIPATAVPTSTPSGAPSPAVPTLGPGALLALAASLALLAVWFLRRS
jgi:hypothetical protein